MAPSQGRPYAALYQGPVAKPPDSSKRGRKGASELTCMKSRPMGWFEEGLVAWGVTGRWRCAQKHQAEKSWLSWKGGKKHQIVHQ